MLRCDAKLIVPSKGLFKANVTDMYSGPESGRVFPVNVQASNSGCCANQLLCFVPREGICFEVAGFTCHATSILSALRVLSCPNPRMASPTCCSTMMRCKSCWADLLTHRGPQGALQKKQAYTAALAQCSGKLLGDVLYWGRACTGIAILPFYTVSALPAIAGVSTIGDDGQRSCQQAI